MPEFVGWLLQMYSNETERKIVTTSRDVMAMMVPSGARIMIHRGTELSITQALGSSFTVNIYGNLARIEGKDADAIGQVKVDPLESMPVNATLEDKVWAVLRNVFDPEIPVNIVDLGLVYECRIEPVDDGNHLVFIKMTLTAPGCGMGPVIASEAKTRIESIPTVSMAEVEIVFDPPWTQDKMSNVAKLELGVMW